MNLSALKFFHGLRSDSKNRQFAVVGLGRFGRAVCSTLHGQGYDVLGVDANMERVDQALNDRIVAHSRQLDSTQPAALKEAGLFEQDTVIVAIGNYVQESIITTLNLKEGGVRHVVAKASSEIHEKLLKKVGADHVVFPEHDAGYELARSLTKPGILDRFELDPENSIVEVIVPEEFDQRTISELKLRSRYGLNVLAFSQDGKFVINPDPITILRKGSAIVVIGSNKNLDRLPI
ncbi:potassium channel family protein [Phormidesmis priestleyi]|uniref:potassium channel family protein n=1 Tax=Phormidesmis priestleyi TaxID=268141 RepID=UPI00083B561E|nr:TrkA family potassium uptake protein [Phormidesmis priestleyi]